MTILRKQQKDRLRKAAIRGSRFYAHYLLDKAFIIVTEDYVAHSVTFKKADFCHFTGLTINHLTDIDFFDVCLKGTLRNINLADVQHYNYSTLKTKANTLLKLDHFLHADSDVNLFLSGLTTNTFTFPCAIRNDNENMTMCFIGNDNHARSLRKARNSHNTLDEKRIEGIFETADQKWNKCIYIKDRQEIQKHFDPSLFTESLKRYFRLI